MRGVGQAVGDSRVSVQCRKSICEQCGREGQTVTDRGTGVRLLGRDQSRLASEGQGPAGWAGLGREGNKGT